MILLHYLGSLWIFVGSDFFLGFEEGHEPWMFTNDDFEGLSITQLYIYATYWVCTIVTTVGYGDYTGSTTLEYLVSFGIEFFGFIIFSMIQLAILEIVSLNQSYEAYIQEMDLTALIWFKKLER